MVKASPKFLDILKNEETRFKKKYVKKKNNDAPIYEPTDLNFVEDN